MRGLYRISSFSGDGCTCANSGYQAFFILTSGLGTRLPVPTTVWCVLTCDVNRCAFVVSLVSLCLCIGGINRPYLVNVCFLSVAGLVSLVEDLK